MQNNPFNWNMLQCQWYMTAGQQTFDPNSLLNPYGIHFCPVVTVDFSSSGLSQPQVSLQTFQQPPSQPDNTSLQERPNSEVEREMRSTVQKQRSRTKILKERESAKKNSETNLVNQCVTYLSSQRHSCAMVERALKRVSSKYKSLDEVKLEKVISCFFKIMSLINSENQRRYINKTFLCKFFSPESLKQKPSVLSAIEDRHCLLTKQEFCEVFRRCCFHFFRTVSICNVTSSAKLSRVSRPQHIKRRRIIMDTYSQIKQN